MYTRETAKTYTGTKTLYAWPATRGEYHRYRGWGEPDHPLDAQEAGYLVEYWPRGETREEHKNHPEHYGYISWAPASEFDGSYIEVGTDDWRTRMVQEGAELDARLAKLREFRKTGLYQRLPKFERDLLDLQEQYMAGYAEVLVKRVARAMDDQSA